MPGRPEHRSPLWRLDGTRYGRIQARIADDGALEITRHEMGAADFAEWGGDDHEESLRVAPADVPRFLLALLANGYGGRADALGALRAVCEAAGVPTKSNVWT